MNKICFSIGHGSPLQKDIDTGTVNHEQIQKDFISKLKAYSINMVADVRSLPGSNRNPSFNQEYFKTWLKEADIDYVWLGKDLGGRRRKQNDVTIDTSGISNSSFKNYCDYTCKDEYRRGLDELMKLAQKHYIALCCGETMFWSCHRMIISNDLFVHNFKVLHITDEENYITHEWNKIGPKAVADRFILSYPFDVQTDKVKEQILSKLKKRAG